MSESSLMEVIIETARLRKRLKSTRSADTSRFKGKPPFRGLRAPLNNVIVKARQRYGGIEDGYDRG
jgi:hypothetical protein